MRDRLGVYLGFVTLLMAGSVDASITTISDPAVFSNRAQVLVTFYELRPPETMVADVVDGVRFRWGGGAPKLGNACSGPPFVRAFGPTSCRSASDRGDEFIYGSDISNPGLPLEITLPYSTTRIAFEIMFTIHTKNTANVRFYDGTNEVGSAETPGHTAHSGVPPSVFAGFESTMRFDRIVVTPPYYSFELDNLRFDASARFTRASASAINTADGGRSSFWGNGLQTSQFLGLEGYLSYHFGIDPMEGVNTFLYNPDAQGRPVNPIRFDFPHPVSRAGFVLGGYGDASGFLAQRAVYLLTLIRGTEVLGSSLAFEQGPSRPGSFSPFFGIEATKPFTSVLIHHLQRRVDIDEVLWEYAPAEPLCGNGVRALDEQCDDGNLVDGDGCSSLCRAEDLPGEQGPVARCTYDLDLTTNDLCGASFSIDAGSFDPDGGPVTLLQLPGWVAEGQSRVTDLGVADSFGLRDRCRAVVRVQDRTPPHIDCPPDQTLECVSGGVIVTVPPGYPTASDDCGQPVTASCSPTSSVYELGTNNSWSPIVCSARDWRGNLATCRPTITVVDTVPPVPTCTVVDPRRWDPDPKTARYVQLSAIDACGGIASLTFVGQAVSPGDIVKIMRMKGPRSTTVEVREGHGPDAFREFWIGEDVPLDMVANDGSNLGSALCVVPSPGR